MRSSSREEVVEVFDALEAGYKRALDLSFDVLTTPERLAVLERFERCAVCMPAIEHALINQLAAQADADELGGKLAPALADRLRISRAEASRRIHEAADLGERRAFNGEPLPPVLPATAAAQRDGELGAGHVAVIRSFCQRLPGFVDIETRAKAEAQLARLSLEYRPDEVAKLADKLTDCLNPDGDFTDEDRARRRGLTIGRQDIDGMSPISGWLPPKPAPRGRGIGQTGRPGHVQPGRRRTLHRRHPVTSRHPGRHPQPGPAQPRRTQRRRPRGC